MIRLCEFFVHSGQIQVQIKACDAKIKDLEDDFFREIRDVT